MSRVSLVLLVAIAVLFSTATSQDSESCPENQEWTTCGSACPERCDTDPNHPKPCILKCVIGCQCKENFVLNSNGKCVSKNEC
ncbi:chymotrypsin inhibitor-like [Harpegnathos saltator]|uniref:chymotrypsin inhibitor-like n=1 Tax=Harpegnathos saltator TaxID=610380 RepID=UPI000590EB5E|nr:chymotrypsin inhibitor-like [Harpegnathos saltator]